VDWSERNLTPAGVRGKRKIPQAKPRRLPSLPCACSGKERLNFVAKKQKLLSKRKLVLKPAVKVKKRKRKKYCTIDIYLISFKTLFHLIRILDNQSSLMIYYTRSN
jgi:hypothetical protein